MKKSIQIIATAFAILLGNVGFSQNDTIYFIKDGVVVNKQSILSTDVDSAVFSYPFKLATLTTTSVSSITETSAVCGGNITNNGGATVTSRGICWGTTPNPTPADNSSVNGSGAGSFTSNLSGLTGGTTYYVRAYAINSEGTSYGNELSFTTTEPVRLATLTTTTVSYITETSAVSGGNITDNGGATVTSRGICWGISPNPTPADNSSINGSGAGSFVSNLSGLTGGTTYYVRAYAINSAGTSYGNEVSFTTISPVQLTTLTTTPISYITETSAVSGGNITNDGGAIVTSRGICWGTSPNPTPADNSSVNGSGTGSFTSNLSGLRGGTTYYVRAYAINSAGTSYGNEVSFTTTSQVQLATLTTTPISSITETSAVSGGNITNNGGGTVTSRGICWSTSPNPTTTENSVVNGSGTGSFASNLYGLTQNTIYYIRSYAVNSAGTSYGNEISFTTNSCSSCITDEDGNVYTSVIIGTQEWMLENLRTTKYSDGTAIPNVTDGDEWSDLETGAWSYNDNDSQYEAAYGKLYNWYAVETGKLCPTGWHVPTDEEWTMLTDYLNTAYLNTSGHSGTEGTDLKATSGWSSSGNGTDDYGWNGLPGGSRDHSGNFSVVGYYSYFWSSSHSYGDYAWYRGLAYDNVNVSSGGSYKGNGFSVRCLSNVKSTQMTAQVRLDNGETPFEIYQSGVPIDYIIGKTYQGGLIAYLDTLDGTGLIAAPSNFGSAPWGCSENPVSGADGTGIGTGAQNTADIIAVCSETNTAAYRCDNLTLGGYSDWFLPSKDELNILYQNIGHGNALGLGNVGGFDFGIYFSSTEKSGSRVWAQNFINGSPYGASKTGYWNVRAVRAF